MPVGRSVLFFPRRQCFVLDSTATGDWRRPTTIVLSEEGFELPLKPLPTYGSICHAILDYKRCQTSLSLSLCAPEKSSIAWKVHPEPGRDCCYLQLCVGSRRVRKSLETTPESSFIPIDRRDLQGRGGEWLLEGPRGAPRGRAERSTLYGGLFYSLYHQQIARESEREGARRRHAALARDTPDSIKKSRLQRQLGKQQLLLRTSGQVAI